MRPLNELIASTIKVVGKNVVHTRPGGTYDLNENNDIESRVVRLHLLSHFCDLAIEELYNNGETRLLKGGRIEQLADDLFEDFVPFIKEGVNIFEYADYFMREQLLKYAARPVVGCHMNAGETEKTEGLPEGWWYDFPGHAHKYFDFGHVVIDEDECIRVMCYCNDDADLQRPVIGIDVKERGNYSEVVKRFVRPEAYTEIIIACEYVYAQNHI